MISMDGGGRLIDFDLARDRDETDTRMSIRTVSRNVRRNFETRTSYPPRSEGHMAIYVDSVVVPTQKGPRTVG